MSYEIIDNTPQMMEQFNRACEAALQAIGIEAVGHIRTQMDTGYHTPHGKPPHTAIRDTSALINEVHYEVEGDAVYVGNNIKYADYVHYGTSRLEGRPYINDAVSQNTNRYNEIIAEALGNAR